MYVCTEAFAFGVLQSTSFSIAIADTERSLLWSGIIILAVVVGILGASLYRSKIRGTAVPSAEELRGRLAQVVTMWALVAILVLGITILVISGYHAAVSTDTNAPREFVDTAKYVFAAVVPVVAGWVGTVMAFYFGKENFRAATESVSQIAKQFTSQEKLGQTRAQDIGKAIEDVAPLRLGATDTNATITLDKL
jgi:hypothetical protein